MINDNKTILVTGATGQQGGATTRRLLADGWQVRALVRDPHKLAAQALVQAGATLAQGDLNDGVSLAAALEGVYGVFSVQTPFGEAGVAGEAQQGKALADASKAAGVQHMVYSAVGGAERNTGIPHFESKWQIEQHIRALGLPATVLRPVFFMENFNLFMRPQEQDGRLVLAVALNPDKPLQLIAAEDIAVFAALAFADPATYQGQALELAGDELTMPQVAALMSQAAGRTVQFAALPIDAVRSFNPESAVMFEWFNESGYAADIPALRAQHPALLSFADWLVRTGWRA